MKRYIMRRHPLGTFSALLAICLGNSMVTSEFPAQRPVTRSFDVFFDLRLNKRLNKQSRGWWLETPSCPLLRHCNDWDIKDGKLANRICHKQLSDWWWPSLLPSHKTVSVMQPCKTWVNNLHEFIKNYHTCGVLCAQREFDTDNIRQKNGYS